MSTVDMARATDDDRIGLTSSLPTEIYYAEREDRSDTQIQLYTQYSHNDRRLF